ncbi:YkgJ family cysteine cluster protein [uncultured Desulfosarcina sp.]|uniref:YkgJ family cysteine cluster protein n=1 Tax=uncultured Desulfosarcina sp. TaxID=218289 RepID=UPI0029C8BD24|nr:YkgJ family cysteine cluster protein [uncultured Desulfosarcina sp.]
MIPELENVFKKYETFVDQLDGIFETVRKQHPDCVKCKMECSDCCQALFDLSLVEAIYINSKFSENVSAEKKDKILEVANTSDRKIYQLKRKAFKAVAAGEKSEEQVLLEMAAERIRCPLLNEESRCDLYAFRPVTCRLYGIPTAIAGRGHTCGLSAFNTGESYPTVNLDSVHTKLHELSCEIIEVLQSTHVKMGDVLMPLSMALLTVFDEAYLGIDADKKKPEDSQA